MPQIIDETERDQINAVAEKGIHQVEPREKLALILPQIASEVTTAIRAANLAIPILFQTLRVLRSTPWRWMETA